MNRRNFLKNTGKAALALTLPSFLNGCNSGLEKKITQLEIKNIQYIPDMHTEEYTQNIKQMISRNTSLLQTNGVLLEGLENRNYSKDDIENLANQIEAYKQNFVNDVVQLNEELKDISKSQNMLNAIAALNMRQNLPKAVCTDTIEQEIKYFEDKDSITYRNRNSYARNFIEKLLGGHNEANALTNKLTLDSKDVGLAISPGALYLDTGLPTRGIEDFQTYYDEVLKSINMADFAEFLTYEPLKKYTKLNEIMQNINQTVKDNNLKSGIDFEPEFLDGIKNATREKAAMQNISNLPSGNYLLIMGAAHGENLRETSGKYQDVNFKEYEGK